MGREIRRVEEAAGGHLLRPRGTRRALIQLSMSRLALSLRPDGTVPLFIVRASFVIHGQCEALMNRPPQQGLSTYGRADGWGGREGGGKGMGGVGGGDGRGGSDQDGWGST